MLSSWARRRRMLRWMSYWIEQLDTNQRHTHVSTMLTWGGWIYLNELHRTRDIFTQFHQSKHRAVRCYILQRCHTTTTPYEERDAHVSVSFRRFSDKNCCTWSSTDVIYDCNTVEILRCLFNFRANSLGACGSFTRTSIEKSVDYNEKDVDTAVAFFKLYFVVISVTMTFHFNVAKPNRLIRSSKNLKCSHVRYDTLVMHGLKLTSYVSRSTFIEKEIHA